MQRWERGWLAVAGTLHLTSWLLMVHPPPPVLEPWVHFHTLLNNRSSPCRQLGIYGSGDIWPWPCHSCRQLTDQLMEGRRGKESFGEAAFALSVCRTAPHVECVHSEWGWILFWGRGASQADVPASCNLKLSFFLEINFFCGCQKQDEEAICGMRCDLFNRYLSFYWVSFLYCMLKWLKKLFM